MIELRNVVVAYESRVILDSVNLTINDGETLVILGGSGSGKSTLLHLIGGVDRPTSGKVFINDEDIYKLNNGAHKTYPIFLILFLNAQILVHRVLWSLNLRLKKQAPILLVHI